MGAGFIEPEDRLAAFGLLPVDGEVHPVLDRRLVGRGRAPDVALLHLVLVQHRAVVEDHRTVPAAGISKVVGWEPYSSAFCAIRPIFCTVPAVAGSSFPFFLKNSIVSS
jgi:hypothetical protein